MDWKSFSLGSAPCSSSIRTICRFLVRTAMCRAVWPRESCERKRRGRREEVEERRECEGVEGRRGRGVREWRKGEGGEV